LTGQGANLTGERITEEPSATLQASAQALFKATDRRLEIKRGEFMSDERAAISPILPNKVLRYVLR